VKYFIQKAANNWINGPKLERQISKSEMSRGPEKVPAGENDCPFLFDNMGCDLDWEGNLERRQKVMIVLKETPRSERCEWSSTVKKVSVH
jgi:hypothetical protein